MDGTVDKRELLIFIDDLKIKSNSLDGMVWYDQALQDVADAVIGGRIGPEGSDSTAQAQAEEGSV